MQFSKPHEVKETLDASVTQNEDGSRQLKNYSLIKVIGKGAFGKVHLAIDPETKVHYAAKEFSKSKLRKKDKANLFNLGPRGRGRGGRRRGPGADDAPGLSAGSPLDLIRGEVAILKKLNHPNIVRLYEVLDVATDDSMYMIFEYCEQGALMEVSLTEEYKAAYGDAECRSVFRQIILGIEYLHEHGIIHRDIKPDNLLRSHGVVKIVDFGVSEMFDKKGDDMTKKSAGSPAFMAPELCRPDHGEVSGRATDIWSMGITLYCLRYGRLPYVSESILEMQRVIREEDFEIPEEKDPRFESLIRKLLEKDPNKRITIDELRNDPWVTDDDKWPLMSKEENTATAVTNITEAELKGAIRKINSLAAVVCPYAPPSTLVLDHLCTFRLERLLTAILFLCSMMLHSSNLSRT
ncbi:kinase-like domain-containing protein [Gamsiella multidivaricata]|uniref:kinase-like domain-containing protein n=1 Tax=Gamsiella multidivaricata TaxID=101098 RepID=UPI00222018C4|nr:kinase-like domain-containing protein [Gamsiella multidivaricata]KAI7821888.1 kinase-like domain-containing protein [Gamsiella multidivaricata]